MRFYLSLFFTFSVFTFTVPRAFAEAYFEDDFIVDNGVLVAKQKCDPDQPIEKNVTVLSAADGDTLNVKTKSGVYAIRMIGMDTPETHYFGHNQGKWGEVAADRMAELVPTGTKVRLEFSPSVCDMYGRVLAHVFKGKVHLNKQMIQEGLAVNYCMFPSVDYCDALSEAARAAIEERRGMFADSNVELPYDFRRRVSNRGQTSFVGNLFTKEVFRPGHQDRTPIADRIFFSSQSNVKAPYFVVD